MRIFRSSFPNLIFFVTSLLGFVSIASGAVAQGIEISHIQCGDLDTDETSRLMQLELSELAVLVETPPSLLVHIVCELQSITIELTDKVTKKHVTRSILSPPSSTMERVIALTASQLVIVSLLEDSIQEAGLERRKKNDIAEKIEEVEVEKAEVEEAIEETAVETKDKEKTNVHKEISLAGGVKIRSDLTIPMGIACLRGDLWITPGIGILPVISFEGGSVVREIGSVTAIDVMAGIGTAWRTKRSGKFFLEINLFATIGYAYLKGNPEQGVIGGSGGGIIGELGLGIAPTLIVDNILVAIEPGGGYTFGNPMGRVENESSISFGGGWLGVTLRFGLVSIGPAKA